MARILKRKPKAANRPKFDINWKHVDDLLAAGCLGTEIAATLGIHPDTLYRRCEIENKVPFSNYLQEKRAKGETILRAAQYDEAVRGRNTTLLIWLGKQRLGQLEKQNVEHSGQMPIQIINYSDKQIEQWTEIDVEESKPEDKQICVV